MIAGDDDDGNDDGMLSPTTTLSSSLPGNGNGPIVGQYSTRVFQDRAIDVSRVELGTSAAV